MKLAISNIAWDVEEDGAIARLLHRHNVDSIDIAPGKYFPSPALTTDADIQRVKAKWAAYGISIIGMQAILFGTSGLNMFGSTAIQVSMLDHLSSIIRIASRLGVKNVVFGSPKNRDRSGLSDERTNSEALSFFLRLGDIAQTNGVAVCLEPNPSCYGANFMTTTEETVAVVERVNHPYIKMQFDTGAITLNKENHDLILKNYAHLIGHIHVSEPNLVPLGDCETDHHSFFESLSAFLPKHTVSIEMLATTNESHVISVERALCAAINYYRPIKETRE